MEIARERFLDASRDYHLTLGVRSRTTAMHSVLTALSPDERIVRPHVTPPGR
jgi:hypothetical protein